MRWSHDVVTSWKLEYQGSRQNMKNFLVTSVRHNPNFDLDLIVGTEKTIHDEETSNVDVAELMADLKVNVPPSIPLSANHPVRTNSRSNMLPNVRLSSAKRLTSSNNLSYGATRSEV